ncbi:MAG: DNA methyltransferase [Bilophila wadsworthia]
MGKRAGCGISPGSREDLKGARKTLSDFHRKLCLTRVLDPACGSGNFLYVTMAHMKRLEGEVINEFTSYGGSFKLEGEQITVDPHQFLGLETNPRAAHIAEMVLWIGYLQWHYQTHGNVSPPEPIIKRFKNISTRTPYWTGVPSKEPSTKTVLP